METSRLALSPGETDTLEGRFKALSCFLGPITLLPNQRRGPDQTQDVPRKPSPPARFLGFRGRYAAGGGNDCSLTIFRGGMEQRRGPRLTWIREGPANARLSSTWSSPRTALSPSCYEFLSLD